MERFGMALPLSSSFQSQALASLLNGFNRNIIGHFFIDFNNSGLVLFTVGSSSGSVIIESVLVPHVLHNLGLLPGHLVGEGPPDSRLPPGNDCWGRTRVRQNAIIVR